MTVPRVRLRLIEFALLISALFGIVAQSQQIQFTNVPGQANEGTSVAISWSGGDGVSPIAVDLVQDGRVIDDIFDDEGDDDEPIPSSITWDIDIDDNVGGIYSLRIVQGALTAESGPINIVDELGRGASTSAPPPTSSNPTSASGSPAATTGTNAPTAVLPSDAAASVSAESASIAATASTLVTTVLEGSVTVTARPAASESGEATAGTGGGGGGLSGGAIAGIVIGVLAGLALVGFLIWFWRRRARQSRESRRNPFNANGDEKGAGGGNGSTTFATPAAVAGVAGAGAAATAATAGKDDKPELPADGTPLHPKPGVHEMHSPVNSDSQSPLSPSGVHEMHSPDGSQRASGGLAHSQSGASRTEGGDSSISELVGSPVGDRNSAASMSPPTGHAIPRKMVPGSSTSGSERGLARQSTIHEMG